MKRDRDSSDDDYEPYKRRLSRAQSRELSSESSEESDGTPCMEYIDPVDNEYVHPFEIIREDPICHENYKMVCCELQKRMPSIQEIMSANMSNSDRCSIYELYQMFELALPCSEEYFSLQKEINSRMKDARDSFEEISKYTVVEKERMDKDAKEYDNKCVLKTGLLKYRILSLDTDSANKLTLYKRYTELLNSRSCDDEYAKLKSWLNQALSLPFNRTKEISTTEGVIQKAFDYLNSELHGMESVKEQVMLFLNSRLSSPNMTKCSLGLIGPPGVGKTHIARLLAKALDYPFEQLSLGGVGGTEFFKGHSYTYIGSQPGRIAKCMTRMGYKNGVLFFDEYEKISGNSDITSTLLHVTDPTQNSQFKDNYFDDVNIDLSNLWFMYSMNSPPQDDALRDRIFIVNVPGYNEKDKIDIMQNHLIPRALRNINRSTADINFSESVLKDIVKEVSPDQNTGVRPLERTITDIINKLNFILMHQNTQIMDAMSFKNVPTLSIPIKVSKKIMREVLLVDANTNSAPQNMYI